MILFPHLFPHLDFGKLSVSFDGSGSSALPCWRMRQAPVPSLVSIAVLVLPVRAQRFLAHVNLKEGDDTSRCMPVYVCATHCSLVSAGQVMVQGNDGVHSLHFLQSLFHLSLYVHPITVKGWLFAVHGLLPHDD